MDDIHNHRFIAVYKNPHIWYLTLLILAILIFTFHDFIVDAIGLPHTEWGVILEVHSLNLILFLLPLVYAAYVFGVRGAVIIISIITLLFIPHTMLLLPAELEHLFADIAFFVSVCTMAVLIGVLRNQRQQIQKVYTAAVESEENLRAYFESAPDGAYLSDLKGTFLYGNKKAGEIMRYKREELIGKSFLKLNILPKKHLVKAGKLLALNTIGRPTGPDEFELIRKDGSHVWVEINTTPIKQHGEVVVIGFVRDITERKQAEEELLRNRALLNETGKMAKVGGWEFDVETLRQTWTDEVYNIHEVDMDFQPTVDSGISFYAPEVQTIVSKAVQRAIDYGEPFNLELPFITAKGNHRWVQAMGKAYRKDGKTIRVGGTFQDITERKQAEEGLEAGRKKLEDIMENVIDGIGVSDAQGKVIQANKALAEMHGYDSPDEVIGRTFFDFVAKEELPRVVEMFQEMMTKKEKTVKNLEMTSLKQDGSKFSVMMNITNSWDKDGSLIRSFIVIHDITERKEIEEERRVYVAGINNANEGIAFTKMNGDMLYFNKSTCRIFGYTPAEMKGINISKFSATSADGKKLEGSLREKGEFFGEIMGVRKNGETFPSTLSAFIVNDDKGNPIGRMGVFSDITERKQAEEREKQLQQQLNLTSRLASIGEMASGIAHEINNPLTGVIGFAQLLMQRDIPEDIRKDVEIINDGAQRVASIVGRLLTFARQHKPARQYINIKDAITSVLELRSYEMKVNNIEVVTQLAPHLPRTMADVNQLQQVFLNIIINAEKEMTAAHRRGKLSVKTERINSSIRVSFTDDGPGISKENVDKVFNPFFTTREIGDGTGLGLSICHGIITQHNGRIYAQSELGKGATFVVELPIVAETRQLKKAEAVQEEPWQCRRAKILVVDDETAILDFLKCLLTEQGYQVETVDRTRAALTRLQRDGYDLILLDIKLPGKGGIWLYRHIEAMDPALAHRVLFITGDVMGTSTREFLDKTKVRYITKPLNVEQLKRDINHMLTREPLRQQS